MSVRTSIKITKVAKLYRRDEYKYIFIFLKKMPLDIGENMKKFLPLNRLFLI